MLMGYIDQNNSDIILGTTSCERNAYLDLLFWAFPYDGKIVSKVLPYITQKYGTGQCHGIVF